MVASTRKSNSLRDATLQDVGHGKRVKLPALLMQLDDVVTLSATKRQVYARVNDVEREGECHSLFCATVLVFVLLPYFLCY